jgi:hypothetical protein
MLVTAAMSCSRSEPAATVAGIARDGPNDDESGAMPDATEAAPRGGAPLCTGVVLPIKESDAKHCQ